MGPARRRKKPSVIDLLLREPEQFEFFQAVRLLERLAASEFDNESQVACENIGYDHPAALEAIRFRMHNHLRFPDKDIIKLESTSATYNNKTRAQFLLTVTMMGLTGAGGVLPYHYTEMILQRARFKDIALQRFLDLFNHRTISLFYRAANKYRFPIQYEQKFIENSREHYVTMFQKKNLFLNADLFTESLRSLMGLNGSAAQARLRQLDDNLLRFTGYFIQQPRSAANLASMLSQYFDLPVSVIQFKPQWQEIIPDMLAQLPSKQNRLGQNNALGQNVIIGHKIWAAQSKFTLKISPINYRQYESLAPGRPKLKALFELVRLYVGMDLDYDIDLYIPARELPPARLLKKAPLPLQLGWNGYMPAKDDAARLVKIRISPSDF